MIHRPERGDAACSIRGQKDAAKFNDYYTCRRSGACEWPQDAGGRSTRPRDVGKHLTRAVRAVVRRNPSLAAVIRERDINPAKLTAVVETFSDPRYRFGLEPGPVGVARRSG